MDKEFFAEFLITLIGIFGLTVLISRIMIPILRSHKVGQKILDIGPRWHKSKEGTPTMGGICFITAILLVISVFSIVSAINGFSDEFIPMALTLGLATLNGVVGYIDDYTKLIKKQNEGLKPWQKAFLQFIAAGIYIFAMSATNNIDTDIYIPYFNINIELGNVYYIFMILFIVGMVNAVNFTDGIDGLASTVTFVVGGFFAVAAFVTQNLSLVLISASIIGGTLGFLVYNFHPARVFMGDTGSLFLGGMIVGASFMINKPLILLPVGIIYIIEILSVVIQVSVYKLTHKRVFKMSPIHHHFEKCGWSENKIVLVFSLVTLIFCIIAWFGLN